MALVVEAAIAKKNDKARKKVPKNDPSVPAEPGAGPGTKPSAKVRDYGAHVLVCKGGDCKKRGSKDFRRALKDGLRGSGINRDVRVDAVECLGLCKHGPNAIVYPGGTWYLGLTEHDAPDIVERHLVGGEPVEERAAEFRTHKKAKR